MDEECRCFTPTPEDPRHFVATDLGVDQDGWRFGEVSLQRCRRCDRTWLFYRCEQEAFARSGRWYRGLLTPAQAAAATPGGALDLLATLPWYLYGGSYHDTPGDRSDRPLDPRRA